ncbi:MAG: TlpA disulfide reductase family protein [Gaiellaceae bacterium]|jgi:cytochrome c biogenesis protein CcmG/thiol:disulfide interchange protein DsbE
MRSLKLAGQVVALAAVAGLLGLLVWDLTHQKHAPRIGGPAPNFSLRRIDGAGKLELASLRGKAVVLNFWASWCVPCKGEAAMLEQAWKQYRGQGVVFLGVDYHDVTSDARTFLSHHGITYPTVQDGSGAVGDRYGLTGVPETYFIDRKGRLVGSHVVGTITNQANSFRKGIEAALHS